jgi:hypothetical protein
MHRTSQALAVLLAFVPSALAAQSERERGYLFREPPVTLTLSGGLGLPTSSGDLWAFTFDELTMSRRDMASFDQAVDLAIRLNERFDLVLGYGLSTSKAQTELRDWVDENDQPITQRTRFTRRPLSATVRYQLKPRGNRVGSYVWIPNAFVPYVGLGAGRMSYRFEQNGEFVDSETLEIFQDSYRASGTVGFGVVSTGAVWSIFPSLALTGEMRYLHASADGRPSFVGFDKLDLSGVATTLGFTIRFN